VSTDILQLVGTGSVPAILGGFVYGVFKLGERHASQRAKDALSKWLLTFDVKKAKALPDGTQELFERIFGERHFSLKCFVRSAVFSLGAIAFLGILVFLIYPKETLRMIRNILIFDEELQGGIRFYGDWLPLTLWLPWSILIDYVSLFKTRVILGLLMRLRRVNLMIAVAIVVVDFLIYKLIFTSGYELIVMIIDKIQGDPFSTWFPRGFFASIIGLLTVMPFILHEIDLTFILFWAGLAPSIWMWLYVFTLFITRGLLRSEKVVTWLRWALEVQKTPFQQIGAVAATLAFIVSAAFILVSVEVSRISAAL
jgi:hypothetical protein